MTTQTATPLERATELIGRMTLDEKVMQITSIMPLRLFDENGPIQRQFDKRLGLGIGHICGPGLFDHRRPRAAASVSNGIQRYLVESTRLGIPAIIHNEALNGLVAREYTSFPTPIGLAAAWDPEAVQDMADVIRRQMRSIGYTQALAPVMDVARDARWGRVHETYGEDPYLASALSVAFTRGLQGDDLTKGVIATAKHFLAYAMTEAGQNMAATTVNQRDLIEVYARPFAAAISMAGLGSIMNSYSEYDGVPIGANGRILIDLLRDLLGFDGTVVSDYEAVQMALQRQLIARTPGEAGALSLMGGLDVELPQPFGYGSVLAEEVRAGRVPEARVDEAAIRVLRDKYALGLFENPYVDESPIEIDREVRNGLDIAVKLAEESVTLLKNDGVLPLTTAPKRIAVLGPHAETTAHSFATYTYVSGLSQVKGALQGMQTAMAGVDAGASADRDSDDLSPLEMFASSAAQVEEWLDKSSEDYIRATYASTSVADAVGRAYPDAAITVVTGVDVLPTDEDDIASAVEAARDADLVILTFGGFAGWGSPRITEGEGSDTANIDVPAHQVALIKAVAATGTPVVGVLSTGRPMALTDVEDSFSALVHGYYGGEGGNQAVVDVITGRVNPSGKLPYSMPRHSGQVPVYSGQRAGTGYARTGTDLKKGYLDMPATPLYFFGHGLSYTSFEYGTLQVENGEVRADGVARLAIAVTNVGDRAGADVVQLYASVRATGLTRPLKELVGFARVHLEPGEAATVEFELPLELLSFMPRDGDGYILEAGEVQLAVGSSSEDVRSTAQITVAETVRFPRKKAFLSSASIA